jgi:hypothetical protein
MAWIEACGYFSRILLNMEQPSTRLPISESRMIRILFGGPEGARLPEKRDNALQMSGPTD